jgi:hypothetical protein
MHTTRSVHWLIAGEYRSKQDVLDSPLASLRLRAGALASVESPIFSLSVGDTLPEDALVCVIGKIGHYILEQRQAYWWGQLDQRPGLRLILDYTDDHLSFDSPLRDFYRACLSRVHAVVCSSARLAQSVQSHYQGTIEVMDDALDIPVRAPSPVRRSPTTLLWFGHGSNTPALIEWLSELTWKDPLRLLALTDGHGVQMITRTQLKTRAQLQLLLNQWSPAKMAAAAAQADLTVLPVDMNQPAKLGVSANRLLTSLALGLPTAADTVDSYLPHQTYWAPLRSDEFHRMLADPPAWHARVRQAQLTLLPRFAMPVMGDRWQRLLSRFLA